MHDRQGGRRDPVLLSSRLSARVDAVCTFASNALGQIRERLGTAGRWDAVLRQVGRWARYHVIDLPYMKASAVWIMCNSGQPQHPATLSGQCAIPHVTANRL